MRKIITTLAVLFCIAAKSQITGLAHINIQTKDIVRAKLFYTGNLNFKEVYNTEMPDQQGNLRKFSVLQCGSCVLEIMQPSDTATVKTKVPGIIPHFALEVTGIEKIIIELKNKNVVFKTDLFERPTFLGGIKGVFIYGPEGEEIELLEYTGKKPY